MTQFHRSNFADRQCSVEVNDDGRIPCRVFSEVIDDGRISCPVFLVCLASLACPVSLVSLVSLASLICPVSLVSLVSLGSKVLDQVRSQRIRR